MNFERRYYEIASRWTAEQFGDADRQRFMGIAGKVPTDVKTLVDVGCGNGLFLEHLGELKGRTFERLVGTDRSAAALSRVQTEKVQASIDSLPFKAGVFDAVCCSEVLEHLPQDRFVAAVNELGRIARRYVLVSVPCEEDLRTALTECVRCCCRFHPYYHLRSFNCGTLQTLFHGRGFECREVFYIHPEKRVPAEIEVTLRFLGSLKRAILRQPRLPMVDDVMCPACGYSPGEGSKWSGEEPGAGSVPAATVGKTLRSLLSLTSKHRWIGAVYERE